MSDVEEVKARTDIAEVIGQSVQLHKSGRSLKGLCPFHAEKTPSFIVTPERQTWHCFGACGTGGDVISFVMRRDGVDFPEALRMLAERAGVKLRDRMSGGEDDSKHARLYEANEEAARWFRELLIEADAASRARDYVKARRIDDDASQAFGLGFSLDSWDALRNHLRNRGLKDEELVAAGLVVAGERDPYDRFRNRLVYPIWDAKGRTAGFGARALDDSLPKYLNTTQTPIFDKGSLLYAYDKARQAIRDEGRAVVVEGYMDVIAAHQHGFTNVVASMGTALTERQVRMLKRSAPQVVLALDADAAGTEAAIRGHDVVRQSIDDEEAAPVISWRGLVHYQSAVSIELKVAVLPEGKDPDDVIRSDASAWRALIDGARPVLDYRLDAASERHDLSSPRGRSDLVQEFLPLVTALTDPVVRAHYLQRLGTRARISERDLGTMLMRSQGTRARSQDAGALASIERKGDSREEFLLALILRYPELRREGMEIPPELLWESENRQILAVWKASGESEDVNDAVSMELKPHLERLTNRRLPSFDSKEASVALRDCMNKLTARQLEAEKRSSEALLSALEEALGSSALSAEGDRQSDDDNMREFESVLNRDTETGLRLHARERSDPPEGRIESGANG
jgi:DNA primase